jgi:glutathione synthase/RimK-type ligase-like ATP-grasp enzyme
MQPIYLLRNKHSRGASALCEAMRIRRNRVPTRMRRLPEGIHTVINWGCTQLPVPVGDVEIMNHTRSVSMASNKLETLQQLELYNVPRPTFTTERGLAVEWIRRGRVVMARTQLTASGGRGLVVCRTEDEVPAAPLYTRFFPGRREFRIHVVGGEVVHVQQKRRRSGREEDPDHHVRTHSNGYVFCQSDVDLPPSAEAAAIAAADALDLDFGAVDLRATDEGRVVVLEANTAPGLEGTTIRRYAEALSVYIQEVHAERNIGPVEQPL